MVICCAVFAGWERWREDGEREQQARDEGGEAGKSDRRWAGCGALDARYLGGYDVVHALGGDAPLFVAADFLSCDLNKIVIKSTYQAEYVGHYRQSGTARAELAHLYD